MDIFHKPLADLTLLDLGKVAALIIGALVLLGIVAATLNSWLEEFARPKPPPPPVTGVWKILGMIQHWFVRLVYAAGVILLVAAILGWLGGLFGWK